MVSSCSSKRRECTIRRAVTSLQCLSTTTEIAEEKTLWSAVSEMSTICPNLVGGGLKETFGDLWNDGRWNLVVTALSQRPRTKTALSGLHSHMTAPLSLAKKLLLCLSARVWCEALLHHSVLPRESKQAKKNEKNSSALENKCRVTVLSLCALPLSYMLAEAGKHRCS